AKTLMERQVSADCDDLVVGMGGDDQHTLLINCTELNRHTVSEAVNAAEETRCSSLKYAVEEWRSLHFGTSPIKSTGGGAARGATSLLDQVDPTWCQRILRFRSENKH